jgi:malate dehydrogenase
MNKVTIVGAGRVGETAAQMLAEQQLCRELVVLDVRQGVPQGVALDILQTAAFFDFDTRVSGGCDPAMMAGSDLVVVTAGFPRKQGQSRSDVLETNLDIIDRVLDDVLRFAPEAMLILVTNPVDVMTYRAWQRTGWGRERVFGQAGVLDAARMASFVALETGFSSRDITTMVLGGHGGAMVPLPRYCTINGIPLEKFIDSETLAGIIERTRSGGSEILALRQNSSAYEAPAAAVAAMVEAITFNRRRILPCVSILDGEYGERDIAMGVPCIIASAGLESVVQLDLNETEQKLFTQSVACVREDLARMPV